MTVSASFIPHEPPRDDLDEYAANLEALKTAGPELVGMMHALTKFDENHHYDRVQLPPDLWLPRYANIAVRDEPELDVDLDIKVSFDAYAGRYVADSIHLVRRAAGEGVNTVAIRAVPVQEYLRALSGTAYYGIPPQPMPEKLPEELVAEIKADGPSNESLRWVARIYTIAEAFNLPPGQAVREQLGMPTPTASVWIRRARDRGILRRWPLPPIAENGPALLQHDRRELGGWQWEA